MNNSEGILFNLLAEVGKPIANFIKAYLPQVDVFWWDNCIVRKLREYQISRIKPGDLQRLDIGTLLTALNRNFDTLSELAGLKRETKFYIKETQCMRNKLAHWKPGDVLTDADFARDLDTLYRLCTEINADSRLLEKLAQLRHDVILKIYLEI